MKHQYEDYIKWIDNEVKKITNGTAYAPSSLRKISIASLLANKATLERHNPDNNRPVRYCPTCADEVDNYQEGDWLYVRIEFPCPSVLDVTNQLDLVMEERNE